MSLSRPGWVFYSSVILLVLFVSLGVVFPDGLVTVSEQVLSFTTLHFGWLYLFATSGFLVFCVGVAVSDYGCIRLGADGEAPEFPYST